MLNSIEVSKRAKCHIEENITGAVQVATRVRNLHFEGKKKGAVRA